MTRPVQREPTAPREHLLTGASGRYRVHFGAYGVRELAPGEEQQVVALLQDVFGGWPSQVGVDAAEFFRWKYRECPFGESLLLVAEAAGEIVGFEARMPWTLLSQRGPIKAIRAVDLAVAPAHRRRGVSMAILRAATYTSEVALTWGNPNSSSRRGRTKLGRREAGAVRFYLRPQRRLSGTIARRSQSAPAPTVDADRAGAILAGETRLPELLAGKESAASERLATARDLEYLLWRYCRFDEYHAVSDEQTGGVAVFRVWQRGPLWVADVCELLVDDAEAGSAARLLAQVARAAPVDVLRCCFPSRLRGARHGFLRLGGKRTIVAMPLHADVQPDPLRLRSWTFSLGDLELL